MQVLKRVFVEGEMGRGEGEGREGGKRRKEGGKNPSYLHFIDEESERLSNLLKVVQLIKWQNRDLKLLLLTTTWFCQ